ncbi:hypothetical protein EC957_008028 [Mortierella hygrophila]|uniref:TM2 domain-containing protein n=1 Tax=Mortierella hygrophila TaxID=979708 RepID=A0A9P6FCK3_9FUNG|nr:hypothetical protein EC957_008028 [Mortierella hygrophila]
MSFYGATTGSSGLFNYVPIAPGRYARVPVDDGPIPVYSSRFGRFGRFTSYDSLTNLLELWHSTRWRLFFIIALAVTLGPYYSEENKRNPPICESVRSYPAAIFLSMCLGWLGIDRFYLGYTLEGLVKLFTAGGFGFLWVADFILLIFGGLRDNNGCTLAS